MGLDIVELVMAVEDEFEIKIPNEDAARLRTVGDVYWYVREHTTQMPGAVAHQTGGELARDPLWERVITVIEQKTSVKRKALVPSARFVEDLALD